MRLILRARPNNSGSNARIAPGAVLCEISTCSSDVCPHIIVWRVAYLALYGIIYALSLKSIGRIANVDLFFQWA